MQLDRIVLVALALHLGLADAQAPKDYPEAYALTIAAARKEGKVVVYSVLSNKAAQPLVSDFKALYPGIEVEYDGESGSTEVTERFLAEVGAGKPSADVMWSSAMDLQMKLVADGHAASYASPEAAKLPAWARYKDEAYGTTFEPVVFVYNKQLLNAADVPQDHDEFASMMALRRDLFRGKVTTFDIEKSGVGFMFAAQDSEHYAGIGALLKAMGGAGVHASAGTGEMLTKIAAGQYLLGYNVMGAYAMVRSKKDLPSLGVVLPKDYTLVLSRVMFISRNAKHPHAARLWLDYVLSQRGQKVIGDALELFAVRDDVQARYSAAGLAQQMGRAARPIPLSAAITQTLKPGARDELIRQWKSSIAEGAAKTPRP